jgi:eukaryotic-like serine/threonine-protein kinase
MAENLIGDWIIEETIGQSGLGIVYRVHQKEDATQIMAIKVLTHPLTQDPKFQNRFQAEMAVLRRLDHPHIVRYYDHGVHEGQIYYVMDCVEGTDFDTRLREGNKPKLEETLTACLQIVSALRYAHRRGILHRGLKPSNVLIGKDGKIKLSDFGILKLFVDAGADQPLMNLLPPAFTSPEQISGKAISKRTDFYAVGTLMYTLLVGRPPFTGNNFVEIVQKVCFTLPERPIHFVADLPEEVDYLIVKLLAKDPSQRPGSGTLLLEELEKIWSELERRNRIGKKPELPASSAEIESPLEGEEEEPEWRFQPSRKRDDRLQRAIILGGALLIVIGILVWAFYFRVPSAESLYEAALPLMQSEKPEDWEKAWDEYLSRLSQKYPDQYAKEVADMKFRVERIRELRLGFNIGKQSQPRSEAERFYYEGYRLCQAGDFAGAKQRWQNLIGAFGALESEKEQRWVKAASLALKRLE